MSIKKITNPLERRRIHSGFSQSKMSKLLGINQSQYSRIERGDADPSKHLKKLSEIFNCNPSEVFQGKILREIEDEFLNVQTKEWGCKYHEKKPDKVFLNIEGWYSKAEIKKNLEFIMSGFRDMEDISDAEK